MNLFNGKAFWSPKIMSEIDENNKLQIDFLRSISDYNSIIIY